MLADWTESSTAVQLVASTAVLWAAASVVQLAALLAG